jgi:D-aminoacyl-tRNA deacylase
MKLAIIASSKDPAGVNIRNQLIESFDFLKTREVFEQSKVYLNSRIAGKSIKLYLTNNDLLNYNGFDVQIKADVFIFLSKHQSRADTPSFAVHAIGNWGLNELGGKEKTLCGSCSIMFRNIFLKLNEIARNSGYELTMEATHHGPYVEKPSLFVEIGSTEQEWNNPRNGEIIAKTIMKSLESEESECKTAIGIGGPHYCNNFNKAVLRSKVALSHICPKYMLEKLDEDLIKQAVRTTSEKVDFVLVDWKGLGKEKLRILEILERLGLEYKRCDKISKD